MSKVDRIILTSGLPWCPAVVAAGVWGAGVAFARFGLGISGLGAAFLVSGLVAIAVFSALLDRGACQSLH
ncbi:MAG: hypothetical protein ACM33T_06660 [Solirubrobacterales bacterium]